MRPIVVVFGMLALVSCGGPDDLVPTRGLSPEQIRSARFLEREVVLDVRLEDDAASSTAAETSQIGPVIDPFRLGEGWLAAEQSGRWAVGDRSTLSVYVADPTDLHLYLESQGPDVESVQVWVNGVEVGLMTPGVEWSAHRLRLEPGALHAGVNEIAFAFVFPSDRPQSQTTPGDLEPIMLELFGQQQPSLTSLHATLPRIREVFPGASIHGVDLLNLPGICLRSSGGTLAHRDRTTRIGFRRARSHVWANCPQRPNS